jgi:putative inorganic carbon (hco3(-)) transporter
MHIYQKFWMGARRMSHKPSQIFPIRWQTGVLIFAFIFALISGSSIIVGITEYSPLIILAGVAAVCMFIVCLRMPVLAVYAAIFVDLLPTNLISADINSLLNRTFTIFALVVWLFRMVTNRQKLRLTTSGVMLICFIGWAGLSLLWADRLSPGIEVIQMYGMRFILFFLLMGNEIQTRKDLSGLMTTLALSGCLLAVTSIISIVVVGYITGTRLQVLGENSNGLGLFLLISAPGVFWWARKTTGRLIEFRQLMAFFYLLLMIGLIGLSGSRGSAISLGITVVAMLFWKDTRPWGVACLVVLVIAVVLITPIFSTTLTRFLGGPGETILGGRESIWPAGWNLINDNPMFGVGIGNSNVRVIPYLVYSRYSYDPVYGDSLHNPILVIWADTGVMGLVLYMGMVITAGISFIKEYFLSKKLGETYLVPFYAIVSSVFLGFMASWVKGGGMEKDFSIFLILALLLIPAGIHNFSLKKLTLDERPS